MTKGKMIVIGLVLVGISAVVVAVSLGKKKDSKETSKEVVVTYGVIENMISTTGNIQPQNRIAIKPPIGGRVDKILVQEGQMVKTAEVLALMSSTERATLLDAARLQGPTVVQEWEDVYKPTPLLAPIDGQVIVKAVNPGQTVTTADDIIVLSDRLIIQAQVDETDVGKVKLNQAAKITLDAYPEIAVTGHVDHIYYESKIVNNVTIYAVDIVPDEVPDVFRSGMSANIDIIQQRKEHVLLLPKDAVKKKDGENSVLLKGQGRQQPNRQIITVGSMDENNIEITSGLKEGDTVVIKTKKYTPMNKNNKSSSPFMPTPGRMR